LSEVGAWDRFGPAALMDRAVTARTAFRLVRSSWLFHEQEAGGKMGRRDSCEAQRCRSETLPENGAIVCDFSPHAKGPPERTFR